MGPFKFPNSCVNSSAFLSFLVMPRIFLAAILATNPPTLVPTFMILFASLP